MGFKHKLQFGCVRWFLIGSIVIFIVTKSHVNIVVKPVAIALSRCRCWFIDTRHIRLVIDTGVIVGFGRFVSIIIIVIILVRIELVCGFG